MRGLPLELADAICDDLVVSGDLRNLREVNKWWHGVATSRVFRTLRVTSTCSSATNATNILQTDALARYIREVEYQDMTADSTGEVAECALMLVDADDTWFHDHDDIIDPFGNVFKHLDHAPVLSSVKLIFSPLYREYERPFGAPSSQLLLQEAILLNLAGISPTLSLHSLTIINILAPLHPLLDKMAKIVPPLRAFHIDVLSHDDYHAFHSAIGWEKFWDTCMQQHLLPPAGPNSPLEALTIRSQVSVGINPKFSLAHRTYPRLSSLFLTCIMFHPSVGTEEFIVKHASTLKRLELEQCEIPVDKNEVPVHHWAAIWDRLKETLTNVEELVVHEYDEDGDSIAGYSTWSEYYGRSRVGAGFEEKAKAKDEPALRALMDMIESRKAKLSATLQPLDA